MLQRTTIREIKNSLGRYIAILAIIALGVGFFSGLKVTKTAMIDTADDYISKSNLFDYKLISTLGFDSEAVNSFKHLDGVKDVIGSNSIDVLYTSKEGTEDVIRIHSITENINRLQLSDGRFPKENNECVVDSRLFNKDDLNTYISFSDKNQSDTLDDFKYKEYKIVGICQSPYYLNFERGSSTLGNGSVLGFAYINQAGFKTNYFSEIFLTISDGGTIYSDSYKKNVSRMKDPITEKLDSISTDRYNTILDEANDELKKGQKKYDDNYNKYLNEKRKALDELAKNKDSLDAGERKINSNLALLEKNEKELLIKEKEIDAAFKKLNKEKETFANNKPYMTEEQIAEAIATFDATEKKLVSSRTQVESAVSKISKSRERLLDSKRELAANKEKYYIAKNQATKKLSDAKVKLDNAKSDLQEAKKDIAKIHKPKNYALNRESNIGYACFESDSNIVNGIAKVFPIFFFLIAALVCMTTMTRMVDEQRTQIGILKALGYSNGAIMGKYLFYSGSAALLGTVIGFLGGCYIFPLVIWNAYGMMYDFSGQINFIFDWPLAIISLIVALICSIGATFFSCYEELKIVAAELIRPKAPKNGKRIALEYITPIWKKISFLYKVTLRNIFRYKKRFFMMVLGISGCTALLLTGLGVRDSIKNVVDFQYDEIQVYDYSVIFDGHQDKEEQSKFIKEAAPHIESAKFLHVGSADLVTKKNTKSISLVVDEGDKFRDFVDLHNNNKNLSYPKDGEVIICEKLANQFDISEGDIVTIRDDNMNSLKAKVSGICENYVYNFVYTTPSTCESQWGYKPEINSAYINAKNNSKEEVLDSSSKIMEIENVMGTSVNYQLRDRVSKMMKSLDYVILLVILSAGALAFIVLYNLTNINITERIREIATIKVLGFYPKETSAYVFRENLFLTGISSVVGLVLGKILHAFVITQIQVDMLSFDIRITPLSYVASVILTFVFAIIVNIAMYYKLDKISMTESLKSIE